MPLSPSQRRYLRGLAHSLKPVVTVGAAGTSPSLLKELELALDQHELLKVRLAGGDRDQHQAEMDSLIDSSGAELVQRVGHVATLYRPHPSQPKLALPRR